MSDNFDVRYLTEVMQRQARFAPSQITSVDQESAFLHYTRALTLYAEGKFFSGRSDVAQMAKRLAAYEHDVTSKAHNEVVHEELLDIWRMIGTLDGAIPSAKRPS